MERHRQPHDLPLQFDADFVGLDLSEFLRLFDQMLVHALTMLACGAVLPPHRALSETKGAHDGVEWATKGKQRDNPCDHIQIAGRSGLGQKDLSRVWLEATHWWTDKRRYPPAANFQILRCGLRRRCLAQVFSASVLRCGCTVHGKSYTLHCAHPKLQRASSCADDARSKTNMPFQQIFPGVYEFANGPVNEWLIEDADGWTLVDTGDPDKEQAILSALTTFGKKPTDIKHILVTHTHPDHAGELAVLKRATDAPAWVHPLDAQVVRGVMPMTRSTPSPDWMSKILYNIFIKNVPSAVPHTEIENEIADGQRLPFGGGLRVIHTPGHSAGHCSFMLERDGGLLFAADACANMLRLTPSIVYDDHAQGRESLRKLAQLNFAAVCFGHGKVLSDKHARKFNDKWR